MTLHDRSMTAVERRAQMAFQVINFCPPSFPPSFPLSLLRLSIVYHLPPPSDLTLSIHPSLSVSLDPVCPCPSLSVPPRACRLLSCIIHILVTTPYTPYIYMRRGSGPRLASQNLVNVAASHASHASHASRAANKPTLCAQSDRSEDIHVKHPRPL